MAIYNKAIALLHHVICDKHFYVMFSFSLINVLGTRTFPHKLYETMMEDELHNI